MAEITHVKVWDPIVRLFHWTLVCAFIIEYVTEDDFLTLHIQAGYFILIILAIRLTWGIFGSRYARFSNFIYRPEVIIEFIKDTLALKAKRYPGHNPAGGAMVILLLISLLLTSITGILVLGAEEHTGPVAQWFTNSEELMADIVEETHEFFANFTLLLVFIHLAGVFIESRIHKEDLIRAMFTGTKSFKS